MSGWTKTFLKSGFLKDFIPEVKECLWQNGLPCKAVMLIVNVSTHSFDDLILLSGDKTIVVKYLPANTTAIIYPLN